MPPGSDHFDVQRAFAHLKPVENAAGSARLNPPSSSPPVVTPFSDELVTCYLVDMGQNFRYVTADDIERAGVTPTELHLLAVANLFEIAKKGVSVNPYGPVNGVLAGGNIEASLLLVDEIWEQAFRGLVKSGFAVAVPARDMLAFCDEKSSEGVAELHRVVDRVFRGGDHLLTRVLYRREAGRWLPLDNQP